MTQNQPNGPYSIYIEQKSHQNITIPSNNKNPILLICIPPNNTDNLNPHVYSNDLKKEAQIQFSKIAMNNSANKIPLYSTSNTPLNLQRNNALMSFEKFSRQGIDNSSAFSKTKLAENLNATKSEDFTTKGLLGKRSWQKSSKNSAQ